ncbi:P-loop containing nucleoside triphosphate hydrolase protein [Schizopora paradoxa]|uniref:DNA 3'-5' helicase n=1 Tax=Schizopora paradoxa TaxID=27342 RepID=A0A0H2RKE2_9AGAM|nr:P-loop containing nucleoside triphosphate hydrolase protein [Schizopora paradoxa]
MNVGRSSACRSELSFDDAIDDATQPSNSARSNKENRCPVRQPLPSSSRPTRIPQPITPTTPRTHKQAGSGRKRTDGVIELSYGVDRVKSTVKRKLKLDFDIDDWQAHLIQKILERYDSICIAGTGYGKSILFEGVAAMSKRKIVIVVCPLKVLEKDQVKQAEEKGIRAIYVNSDNCKAPGLWANLARGAFQMIYMSPEMLRHPQFLNLMLDPHFREMLAMIAIDESHLIQDWGEDFRIEYKKIHLLRAHTGRDIPFLAVTATATTETFEVIWDSLSYGCRPFWGIDVGCERPNLQYMSRPLTDPSSPLLDILNLLPATMDDETRIDDLSKILFFRNTREECSELVRDLRRVLPPHLRAVTHAFYSSLSEEAKDIRWNQYCNGELKLMVSTVASAVGCNVRDIEWVVNLGITESLSGLSQRFGRAGRDPSINAKCAALIPSWAVRPPPETVNPAIARIQGTGAKVKKESKRDAARREKLEPGLEQFINVATPGYEHADSCAHAFMRDIFRPVTNLDVYNSLEATLPSKRGSRSTDMPFVSKWTVLTLKEGPEQHECCHGPNCNPTVLDAIAPADKDDPRLLKYASDFLSLKIDRKHAASDSFRPSSVMSDASTSSVTLKKGRGATKEEKTRLAEMLLEFREGLCDNTYGRHVVPEMLLPDSVIKKMMEKAFVFLCEENRNREALCRVVEWNLASDEQLDGLIRVLDSWSQEVQPPPSTPTKPPRDPKRAKVTGSVETPVPSFALGTTFVTVTSSDRFSKCTLHAILEAVFRSG